MFENWCRSCTGESLEISEDMAEEQNIEGDTKIDNDIDVSTTAMILQHSSSSQQSTTNNDSIIVEFNDEKFNSNNNNNDIIKMKNLTTKSTTTKTTEKINNNKIKRKHSKIGQEKKQYARQELLCKLKK